MRAILSPLLLISSLAIATAQGLPPNEIMPTRHDIQQALNIFSGPDYNNMGIQLHFRRYHTVTMACVYRGGTGGFCTQTPQSLVRKIDAAVATYCADPTNAAYPQPAHALTGEADGLGYHCVNGHMVRKPYSSLFDEQGYMRIEWVAIPPQG